MQQNTQKVSLMADDWVIELMKNNASHLELVKDASFDVGYGCIGNTSTETVIGLGEVDFGSVAIYWG